LENEKKSTGVTRHIKLYRFLFPRRGLLKWWDLAVDYVESELSKIKAVLGKEAFFFCRGKTAVSCENHRWR
jgi:hypothetical protein